VGVFRSLGKEVHFEQTVYERYWPVVRDIEWVCVQEKGGAYWREER